jgi:hypothetical protein
MDTAMMTLVEPSQIFRFSVDREPAVTVEKASRSCEEMYFAANKDELHGKRR